jgi:molybdopterin-guanine dinucleotide biosynthesis protein A
MDIGGIILAGGKAKRIGKNKCMLTLNDHTLLQIVAETLSVLCKEVIVVAKKPEPYSSTGLAVIVEDDERQLPLIGLLAGLESSNYEKYLVAACDMPFIHPDSLRILVDCSDRYDAVLPVIGDRVEPLHALYSRSCIPFIKESLVKGDLKLTSFLEKANVKYIKQNLFESHDPELLSFYNINTDADYRKALEIEQGSKE